MTDTWRLVSDAILDIVFDRFCAKALEQRQEEAVLPVLGFK